MPGKIKHLSLAACAVASMVACGAPGASPASGNGEEAPDAGESTNAPVDGASPLDAAAPARDAAPDAPSDAAPRSDGSAPPSASACDLPTAPDPDVKQALPALVDTSWPSTPGSTIAVHAGDDLQAALDEAQPGDNVVIDAGASFVGPFHLRAKTGSGWIVVRSADPALPPAGTRVMPADASHMPKILAPTSDNALVADAGASHWRVVGVEVAPSDPSTPIVYDMVVLGDPTQTTLNEVADHIVLDRVYVHGTPTASIKRGVNLASAWTAVIDSWISDIHVAGQDSQAIACTNGPGPYAIVDDHLEAAGENVLFGGDDPAVPALVPSDIEIVRNHFYKPVSWKQNDPSYAGTPWTVKNILELKNAQRVLVACNVIENCWTQAQVGFAILLTPRNQNGSAPWSTVQDVTIIDNVVRHSGSAIDTLGTDDTYPSGPLARVLLQNNLFYDIDGTRWDGAGQFLQLLDGVSAIKVDHNTVVQSGDIVAAGGAQDTGVTFTDVIVQHNAYGVIGDGTAPGNASIQAYFPTVFFDRNAIVGLPSDMSASDYPPDNLFPASIDDVGFVDVANDDYRLAPGSPMRGAGRGGSDIGADVAGILAATAGVVK
jgi:hypothetical protein